MTPRREFPESVKRAALERATGADGQPRCQDPQCGDSSEWCELGERLQGAELQRNWDVRFPLSQADVIKLRDLILGARFKYRRMLNPIVSRFQLDGTQALLQIDHERECADGGSNDLNNAIVRCVFCHAFKTEDRRAHRARTPKKGPPEQTSVLTEAKLAPLRDKINAVKTAGLRVNPSSAEAGEVLTAPASPTVPKPRRHFTDADVQAAIRRREQAQEDNWFGV